jgi:hypothetical protein
MRRRCWEALGVGLVLVLLGAIGTIRLVRRTTLNSVLVARLDHFDWHTPQLR